MRIAKIALALCAVLFAFQTLSCKAKAVGSGKTVVQTEGTSPQSGNASGQASASPEEAEPSAYLPSGKLVNSESFREEGQYYLIDSIRYYSAKDKGKEAGTLTDTQVVLFREDPEDEWLYFVTADFSAAGWIYLYDISQKSYFGDFEKNEESGNWFRQYLKQEYEALSKAKNIRRFGPCLIVDYHGKTVKIFNSFRGEGGSILYQYSKTVSDRFIVLREQHYEGGGFSIFDLSSGKIVATVVDEPFFNDDNSMFYALGWYYGSDYPSLEIYAFNNGEPQKILEHSFDVAIFDEVGKSRVQKTYWKDRITIYVDLLSGTDLLFVMDKEKRGSSYVVTYY